MKHLLLSLTLVSICSCHREAIVADGEYDIEATSITHTPEHVKVDDKVVFDQVITNVGTDDIPARSYHVDLYLDGDPIAFDHGTSRIPRGKDIEYGMAPGAHHWQPKKPGTYKYKFIVDPKNTLPETNEGNNIIEGVITVREN